jgi:predicted O-methyltransferase YrrM
LSLISSYRMLATVVGSRRAAQISRAELTARFARLVGGPAWSHVQAPSISSLASAMPSVTSHEEVLDWLGVPSEERRQLHLEFDDVSADLERAYIGASLTCPTEWAVEAATSMSLYSLVRTRRPESVVETGIANGHSSFIILSALARNGVGRLASVDVRQDTGVLVPHTLAERWTRIIIEDRRPDLSVLTESLRPYEPFDLFFHDGDHRFLGQILDYKVGASGLAPDGVLMSDDIDVTSAWLEASDLGLLPQRRLMLLDRRKAVGFATANH